MAAAVALLPSPQISKLICMLEPWDKEIIVGACCKLHMHREPVMCKQSVPLATERWLVRAHSLRRRINLR